MESNSKADNKDIQNVSVKLWELIRRTAEEITLQRSNYSELLDKYNNLENFVGDKNKSDAKLLSELTQLKESLSVNEGQIQALIDKNNELSSSNSELIDYKNKFIEISALFQNIEEQNAKIQSENAIIPELEKQIEHLKQAKIASDAKLEALNELRSNYARLEFDYKLMQKEIVRRNQEIIQKETQLSEIREGKAVAESSVYKYQKSQELLNSLYQQIDEKSLYIAEAEEQAKEKDYKINHLEMLVVELQEQINTKNEQITDLKNIGSLNSESMEMLKYKDNELSEIQAKLDKQSAILKSNENELETLAAKAEEYQSKNENFENQIASINDNYSLKLQEIEDLQSILESKETKIEELNQILKKEKEISLKVSERTDNLENLLSEAKYEIELYNKELENFYALKDENISLSNQVKAMAKELQDINTELHSSEINIQNLKNELNSNEIELINYRNKLDSHNKLSQEMPVLQDKITELQEQIRYQNNDIKLLEVKLYDYNRNKLFAQEIESKLEVATNQIAIKDITIDKLRNKTEELENILKTRYTQIQILEEELNSMLKERNDFKSTHKEIKEKIQMFIMKIDEKINEKQ